MLGCGAEGLLSVGTRPSLCVSYPLPTCRPVYHRVSLDETKSQHAQTNPCRNQLKAWLIRHLVASNKDHQDLMTKAVAAGGGDDDGDRSGGGGYAGKGAPARESSLSGQVRTYQHQNRTTGKESPCSNIDDFNLCFQHQTLAEMSTVNSRANDLWCVHSASTSSLLD